MAEPISAAQKSPVRATQMTATPVSPATFYKELMRSEKDCALLTRLAKL